MSRTCMTKGIFFQAEDGIRDYKVTGVQTCALPISIGSWHTGALASHADELAAMPSLHIAWAAWCSLALWQLSRRRSVRALAVLYPCTTEIGRASCRERV